MVKGSNKDMAYHPTTLSPQNFQGTEYTQPTFASKNNSILTLSLPDIASIFMNPQNPGGK